MGDNNTEQEIHLWWQTEIRDPDGLSGQSVARLLTMLLNRLEAHFVCVIGDEWLLNELGIIESLNSTLGVIPLKYLIERLPHIIQVDWGDFYFCESKDQARQINSIERTWQSIEKSLFTVRNVDGGYYYVYTKKPITSLLSVEYEVLEIKHDFPEKLDYPW